MGEKKVFHVGVIGTGMINGIYMDMMTGHFDILQVDAVAGRNMEKARKVAEKYGVRPCTVEELLADESIDIVVNLTPADVHKELIMQILKAGKHAYTEKTIALDLASAREICDLAESKGLYVGTAPDTFFSGWAQTARRIIDSGKLGTITSFAMAGNRDNEWLLSAVEFLRRPGGGIILDYSGYYLTMLVNLLGPVKSVSCAIRAPYPTHVNILKDSPHFGETFETPNESQFYSVLELENGIMGTFSVNADSVFFDQTYFAIYGSKGILYLSCPNLYEGTVRLYENTYDFSKEGNPEILSVDNPFPFNSNSRGVGVADMAYAILEGREPRASARTACHVLDVQECMVKSQEQNGLFVPVSTSCDRAMPLSIPTDGEESSLRQHGSK